MHCRCAIQHTTQAHWHIAGLKSVCLTLQAAEAQQDSEASDSEHTAQEDQQAASPLSSGYGTLSRLEYLLRLGMLECLHEQPHHQLTVHPRRWLALYHCWPCINMWLFATSELALNVRCQLLILQ